MMLYRSVRKEYVPKPRQKSLEHRVLDLYFFLTLVVLVQKRDRNNPVVYLHESLKSFTNDKKLTCTGRF